MGLSADAVDADREGRDQSSASLDGGTAAPSALEGAELADPIPEAIARRADELAANLVDARQQLETVRRQRDEWKAYARSVELKYQQLVASTSWRLTAPLRSLSRRLVRRTAPEALVLARPGSAGAIRLAREPDSRPPVPAKPVAAMHAEYLARGLDREPDSFVVYRIIGNDLVPRHKPGQSYDNLRFLLEHEPELAGAEKRWVVNRIFDAAAEERIIGLLDERGQPYIRIPFVAEDYRQIGMDLDVLPSRDFLDSDEFRRLGPEEQDRALVATYRLRNNYVMNNNGARNAALRDGRDRAKWILPWDGNCFVTRTGWDAIVHGVTRFPYLKYFTVPMDRIGDNAMLLQGDIQPNPTSEPQLIFRRDAREEFNPDIPYGRRPKVELFWRLGIPGPWDRWRDDIWDLPRGDLAAEAGEVGTAGWVARLTAGSRALDGEDRYGKRDRTAARRDSIRAAIDHLDRLMAGDTGG